MTCTVWKKSFQYVSIHGFCAGNWQPFQEAWTNVGPPLRKQKFDHSLRKMLRNKFFGEKNNTLLLRRSHLCEAQENQILLLLRDLWCVSHARISQRDGLYCLDLYRLTVKRTSGHVCYCVADPADTRTKMKVVNSCVVHSCYFLDNVWVFMSPILHVSIQKTLFFHPSLSDSAFCVPAESKKTDTNLPKVSSQFAPSSRYTSRMFLRMYVTSQCVNYPSSIRSRYRYNSLHVDYFILFANPSCDSKVTYTTNTHAVMGHVFGHQYFSEDAEPIKITSQTERLRG